MAMELTRRNKLIIQFCFYTLQIGLLLSCQNQKPNLNLKTRLILLRFPEGLIIFSTSIMKSVNIGDNHGNINISKTA